MVEISDRLYALASRIDADGTASQIGSADEILEIAKLTAALEERKAEPVAWMNPEHLEAYQDGEPGIAWASPVKTEFYSVPLHPSRDLASRVSAALSSLGNEQGWRSMDSAPKDGTHVLLDLGETIPDLIDVRVGQFISEIAAREFGETLSASGGWFIWNSGDDWFITADAHGWMPLPAAPQTAEESR
ncbi:hypothetical protein LB542_19950 [Mesorhizobium sp. BR1-1-9]|uniref:hypothetical protein n=1 Tax=Mesorhizobium sp. BR1-1-9 TaxID=2876646 RepID=UPI001CD18BF3|nr:hypothetical protein [Mesorhizobium sp. BR1-1-9]MBZ9873125.1 hypothetical protein [Mesorhizobium sp. BR1-1-9]